MPVALADLMQLKVECRWDRNTSVQCLSLCSSLACVLPACVAASTLVHSCQVWREGGRAQETNWGAAPQHSVCSPASSPVLSSHRLPRPRWLHVHEPIGSLVHREAHGRPPQLHGHPWECSTDSECGGDPPQCTGFSVPRHHVCHGAALRSAGSPSRNQPGCPAQLSGK